MNASKAKTASGVFDHFRGDGVGHQHRFGPAFIGGNLHPHLQLALSRIDEEIDALGNSTVYAYDAAGRLSGITDATLNATTTFDLDSIGNRTAIHGPLGTERHFTYLAGGRIGSTTNSRGHSTQYRTDGSVHRTQDALGHASEREYNPYGLLRETRFPDGSSLRFDYAGTTPIDDSQQYPVSTIDEQGRTRVVGYDDHGGARTVTDLGGSPWTYNYSTASNGTIEIGVGSGDIRRVPSDEFAAAYRNLAQDPTGLDSTHHGIASITAPSGSAKQYEYSPTGGIATITYPDQTQEQNTYGAHGLLTQRTLPDGTNLTYAYDPIGRETLRMASSGETRALLPGPNNRVESMTDATGQTVYQYDAAGRFIGIRYPSGASVSYTLDTVGRVTALTSTLSPSGSLSTTTYEYDGEGNMTALHDPLGGATTMEYDALNNLVTEHLPNGVTTTIVYDVRNRATGIIHTSATGETLASVTYERSSSGEPTKVTREDGSYRTLAYDGALRLANESYFSPTGAVVDRIDYTYDADGNRLTRTSLSAGGAVYAYDAGSKLRSVTRMGTTQAYTHDLNGRVAGIEGGGRQRILEFGPDDELLSLSDNGNLVASYTYDGVGRRVARSSTGVATRFLVAPSDMGRVDRPHAAIDEAGNTLAVFTYARGVTHSRITNGSPTYYLHDGVGSVIALVDASGNVTARFDYDGLGNTRAASGVAAPTLPMLGGDFRFQDMWLDSSAGLYLTPARAYDPEAGQFLSRDPATGVVYVPETLYPYAFANQNSYVYGDPSGRDFSDVQVDALVSGFPDSGPAFNPAAYKWLLVAQQYEGLTVRSQDPDLPERKIVDTLPFQSKHGGEWCAMFVSMVMLKAGYPGGEYSTGGSPGALDFEHYGDADPAPYHTGSIMVLNIRDNETHEISYNHVGFYMGGDPKVLIYVLGGNMERLSEKGDLEFQGVWEKPYFTVPSYPQNHYPYYAEIRTARWPSTTNTCLRPDKPELCK